MTYFKTRIYETPLITEACVSTEGGFAESGYNSYGLQDISGDHISDQSDEWL